MNPSENSYIIFMQLIINHCTLNIRNDLTTIFKFNTTNKVKARIPSKSELWKESSNNMNMNGVYYFKVYAELRYC